MSKSPLQNAAKKNNQDNVALNKTTGNKSVDHDTITPKVSDNIIPPNAVYRNISDDVTNMEKEFYNYTTNTVGNKIYFYGVLVLLLLCLLGLFLDPLTARYIDIFVWAFFTIDVVYLFIKSDDKKDFFKKHFFDLIAIVPFYAFFRYFKFVTLLFFVFRITRLGQRYFHDAYSKLAANELGRIIIGLILIFVILPIPLVWIEPQMPNYEDVMWWAVQTTTTVGYGDIVPVTNVGRFIGVILMFLGVGLIGILSSFLTRILISKRKLTFSDYMHHLEQFSIHEMEELESSISKTKKKIITDHEEHKIKKERKDSKS